MTKTTSSARQILAKAIVAFALVAAPWMTTEASAQAVVKVGRGTAGLNLRASLAVGYQMKVRQAEPARVVTRSATSTEVELPVTAASNASWTLSVANPTSNAATAKGIEVLDANGTWRDLANGSTTAVYSSTTPTNGHPVMVRLRLAPGADVDSLSGIKFVMTPTAM